MTSSTSKIGVPSRVPNSCADRLSRDTGPLVRPSVVEAVLTLDRPPVASAVALLRCYLGVTSRRIAEEEVAAALAQLALSSLLSEKVVSDHVGGEPDMMGDVPGLQGLAASAPAGPPELPGAIARKGNPTRNIHIDTPHNCPRLAWKSDTMPALHGRAASRRGLSTSVTEALIPADYLWVV